MVLSDKALNHTKLSCHRFERYLDPPVIRTFRPWRLYGILTSVGLSLETSDISDQWSCLLVGFPTNTQVLLVNSAVYTPQISEQPRFRDPSHVRWVLYKTVISLKAFAVNDGSSHDEKDDGDQVNIEETEVSKWVKTTSCVDTAMGYTPNHSLCSPCSCPNTWRRIPMLCCLHPQTKLYIPFSSGAIPKSPFIRTFLLPVPKPGDPRMAHLLLQL